MHAMRRRWNRWAGILAAVAVAGGCGDDGSTTEIEYPPEVQPFVGTWDAEVFTVTSDADTTIVFDLFEDVSGEFFMNVQRSGTYTATLTIGGLARPEIGTLSVSNGFVTLTPNGGSSSSAPYSFIRDDYLAIGPAPTEFEFNFDGEVDAGQLYFEVQRR